MKQLRDERIEALALRITERLGSRSDIRLVDRARAVHAVSARLRSAFQAGQDLDRAVRERIRSLSREVPEGSREWDMLYRQYSDELSRRR